MEAHGYVFQTVQGESLPHHMTINLGNFDERLNNKEILGATATLWVSHFLYNDKACAAVVDRAEVNGVPINTINDRTSGKHITMCLLPPARPVDSNTLFAGGSSIIEIEETSLDAVVQECW